MVLGDLGDAGERRFEDQARDLVLRREFDGNPRAERLAVEDEPVRRDPFALEKIERRPGVGVESAFGRRARVAAIAAVLQPSARRSLPRAKRSMRSTR